MAFRCMFLGYAKGSKGYRVWNLETNKLTISRTVQLDEGFGETYTTVKPQSDEAVRTIIRDDDMFTVPVATPNATDSEMMEVDEDARDNMDVDEDARNNMEMDEEPHNELPTMREQIPAAPAMTMPKK
ncbi:hypothetical protein PInf_018312 [Phytophthora infestans]|nr:hypothetical protein PInf_018312 [Phytophthora infestans]